MGSTLDSSVTRQKETNGDRHVTQNREVTVIGDSVTYGEVTTMRAAAVLVSIPVHIKGDPA